MALHKIQDWTGGGHTSFPINRDRINSDLLIVITYVGDQYDVYSQGQLFITNSQIQAYPKITEWRLIMYKFGNNWDWTEFHLTNGWKEAEVYSIGSYGKVHVEIYEIY